MINGVWVIDRSGQCLFHWNYGSEIIDPTLFSGFFSALFSFAREIGQSNIENIRMSNVSFTCLLSKGLLFVVSGEKTDNNLYLLKCVKNQFFKKFHEKFYLLGDLLRDSSQEVDDFQNAMEVFLRKSSGKHASKITCKVPIRTGSIIDILTRGTPFREELYSKFGIDGIDVFISVDGHRSILGITKTTDIPSKKVLEIIAFGLQKGMIAENFQSSQGVNLTEIIQGITSGENDLDDSIDDLRKLNSTKSDRLSLIRRIRGLQTTFTNLNTELTKTFSENEQLLAVASTDELSPISTVNGGNPSFPILENSVSNQIRSQETVGSLKPISNKDTKRVPITLKRLGNTNLNKKDIEISTIIVDQNKQKKEIHDSKQKISVDSADKRYCEICQRNNLVDDEKPASLLQCKKCTKYFHINCVQERNFLSVHFLQCPLCGHKGRRNRNHQVF